MEQSIIETIMNLLGSGSLGPILALVGYHYFYSKKEREKNHESIVRISGKVETLEKQLAEVKKDNTKTCSQHMQLVNNLVTEKVFNEAMGHVTSTLQDIRANILEITRRVDELQKG